MYDLNYVEKKGFIKQKKNLFILNFFVIMCDIWIVRRRFGYCVMIRIECFFVSIQGF